jgi:hypothetical protein
MAAFPVFDQSLYSGTMKRIRDADARANGNGTIVLDHRNKGLPVTDFLQPIVKAAAQKMPIGVIDRHRAHGSDHVVWEHKDRPRPDANDRSMRRKQFKILAAVGRQFAGLSLVLFLDPQLFEACDEIIGQIGTISRDTFSRRPHQVKARGRASVPLIDGYHPSPVITAVQRLKSEVRKFCRAADEIDHLENMRNDRSWRKNCDRQLLCRFLGRRDVVLSTRAAGRASEKRQGTKSREVEHQRCNGLYGDCVVTLTGSSARWLRGLC